jgi:hypothetical protein
MPPERRAGAGALEVLAVFMRLRAALASFTFVASLLSFRKLLKVTVDCGRSPRSARIHALP